MLSLEGRTALITGAASGMGRCASQLFASRGCTVLGLDVSDSGLAETAAIVAGDGNVMINTVADVADPVAVKNALRSLIARVAVPDIVVNLAGVASIGQVEEVTDTEWRRVMGIHLDGTFHVCREIVPFMKQRRYGRIVNMSSTIGLHGGQGWAAYSAAKGGIAALTKAMARDLAEYGITVNAIAPGVIATPMLPKRTPAQLAERLTNVPLGRVGQPSEVATLMLYLSCDEGSFITGQIITIDGGQNI